MAITLDGTAGITTPGLTNTGTETIVSLTTTGNTILGDATSDTLTVGVTGIVKDASGNVGIGTASPRATFDVTNATNTGYGAIIEKTAGSGTPNGLFVSTGQNSASNFLIKAAVGTFASSTDAFVVDGTGALKFNSGYGSAATAYGCRAWVNFNGTGTVAIRASGNVTSITDNGVGTYTVNFTTAMPDVNYCPVAMCSGDADLPVIGFSRTVYAISSTSSCPAKNVRTTDNSLQDQATMCVAFFR